jgi:hypothetical protein
MTEVLTFGLGCHVCPRFDDRQALWKSVVDHRLEGVIAKPLREPYRPGERSCISRARTRRGRAIHTAEREAPIRDRARRSR